MSYLQKSNFSSFQHTLVWPLNVVYIISDVIKTYSRALHMPFIPYM